MDITSIIAPLNDAQRAAVTAPAQAMLILAGAGSGKTRVLVHRIVWHIQVNGLSPHSILAVTFTNKAASEMRARIETLLENNMQSMWIGTFHGIAHRILRRHAQEARLPKDFQVLDSSDQQRLIKRLLVDLQINEKELPSKEVQWFINAQKDAGRRSKDLAYDQDKHIQRFQRIYCEYEALCERNGVVDFSELLLRVYELLRDDDYLRVQYQQRFNQIHVDEFQDTNHIQYAWLRLLSPDCDNVFVVGDDDQAIYGWRGAKIENIYNFQSHYPQHQLVKLEQNYRSTGVILKTANNIIAHNQGRMGKSLWTNMTDGEKITIYTAYNEIDEANFVIERIRAWGQAGNKRADVAILYRSNAQSRQFEEQLMLTKTPYRVYGGLRFFDRAEIKNALAYLRLMVNRYDDASFDRVINTPARGIGLRTIDAIRQFANLQSVPLWLAAQSLLERKQLSTRAGAALFQFLDLIEQLDYKTQPLKLSEKVQFVIEHSSLMAFYQQDKIEKSTEKVENLRELVNAANAFNYDPQTEDEWSELAAFLSHAALESGEMQAEAFDDCVQLMTLHTAKGLEFKLVFLVGLEEGLFPAQQSIYDAGRLEEERRLCYVGITRAREKLYMTHAEVRRLYGREMPASKSRFLKELPVDLIDEVRPKREVSRPITAKTSTAQIRAFEQVSNSLYRKGQKVHHASFGNGIVQHIEGEGKAERVLVKFQDDSRWLMSSYTQLSAL